MKWFDTYSKSQSMAWVVASVLAVLVAGCGGGGSGDGGDGAPAPGTLRVFLTDAPAFRSPANESEIPQNTQGRIAFLKGPLQPVNMFFRPLNSIFDRLTTSPLHILFLNDLK